MTVPGPDRVQPPERRRGRLGGGLLLVLTASIFAMPAHVAPAADAPPDTHQLDAHLDSAYRADLADVLERRYLRVLTSNNAFDYYLDGGRRRGFQYEMVRAFVKQLNKRHPPPPGMPKIQFEMIPVADGDLVPMLVAGRGDLIAARLTVTPDRAAEVSFSRPYRTVDEVVVQRRSAPPIKDLKALGGKRVAVRRSSSYHESLVDENEKLRKAGIAPIRIELVDDALPTERILALVANGSLERTVADSMLADIASKLHPELQALDAVRLRQDGRLAWAVQKNAKALLAEVDAFLPQYKEGSLHGNMAVEQYFLNLQPIQRRLEEGETSTISPWDDTFRQLGPRYGFDWRLMAAVAWQESRFDPTARNRSGATGLFQIKPETAAEPYVGIPDVKGANNVKNNIQAGIKYLAWIKQRYFDPIEGMSEQDRVRMTLAAYNAGPRNVARARNRARKMGLDPDRWFRNVELAMLALKKREPVRYVSEINQSYVAYLLLGYE
jgi:membrane-bound lytic murein transglycosylase MltF